MVFQKQDIIHLISEFKMANGNILMMTEFPALILKTLEKNVLEVLKIIYTATTHKKLKTHIYLSMRESIKTKYKIW